MVLIVHSREELEHLLITMYLDGWKIRRLSKHFGISRNTVRKILRKHEAYRNEGHDVLCAKKKPLLRGSKLDPFLPIIKERLEKFPKITGQRLYEDLCDEGYTGGIGIVRIRLRKMRPRPKHEPVVRFETEPGIQGQMDWSPYTIDFTLGGKTKVQCFSYILGYSRRHYIDFTMRRDFFTLIRRHQDAFGHFKGVPTQCLYDSEKTVVLRWEANRPVFNPAFIAFITHYNCRPIACRRGRAETKGKVEAPFRYVESNLLNGREFKDLEDLMAFARWWLRERSDLHKHDTTGRPPLELFMEREQSALHPLPLHPYDSSEVALRVCDFEGYIEYETNRYPVPYEHMADILAMKVTDKEIFVYSPELDLVVRHERLPAGSGIKIQSPQIHGPRKVRYGLEPVREQFLALGAGADEFLNGLVEKHPKNSGFHARHILRLKENFHCKDINKALMHAIRYLAYDCKAIERIVRAKATPRTLESLRNERAQEQLRQTLPKIKQRSLDEYSNLLNLTN